jgi:menaquinone-dependent protoporphyrinogen oxidase
MKKVLIVYGTRSGTTEDIAQKIAKIFESKDIIPRLINLKEVKEKNIPPLSEFDGVIAGTGIKINRWTKTVKKFVKKNSSEIQKRNFKFGFYISCGTASNKDGVKTAVDKYILSKLEEQGSKPDIFDAFGPCYDLTETSNLGKMTKAIMKAALKEQEGIENPEEKVYDFRDWDQIQKFTEDFASLL